MRVDLTTVISGEIVDGTESPIRAPGTIDLKW